MINGPKHHYLFSIAGGVKTTGGVENLTKGEFMIGDITLGGTDGVQYAANLQATKKNKRNFRLYMGEEKRDLTKSRSKQYGPSETFTFSLDQVKDIRVEAPKFLDTKVDEVILGYNGHDASTSIVRKVGSNPYNISLQIQGIPLSYGGGGNNYEIVEFSFGKENVLPFNGCSELDACDTIPCSDYIYDWVDIIRRREVSGGRKIGDILEVTPIVSCASATVEQEYVYWTLSACDTGDASALAVVQAQYPGYVIKRLSRSGSITTYQTLLEEGITPDDFEYTNVSILGSCGTCPAGYDSIPGGFVYSITVEDDGVSAAVGIQAALPNAVASSVVRQGLESGTGVGVYIGVTTAVLTEANRATFIAAYPTATLTYVNTKQAFCQDTTIEEIEWIEGETCSASTETYRISLPDSNCGETRLAELQAAYPNDTVTIVDSGQSIRTITLTGTSGTANVAVTATNYLATFATSLTVTADNFVTAHAAALLADKQVVVTAASGVLTFTGPTATIATLAITNATTNLAGTVSAATVIPANGGCITTYQIVINTNMVCEECDPIFEDFYTSEAPIFYDGVKWTLFAGAQTFSGPCLCGIRFKAKVFRLDPGEIVRYEYPFIEDSVSIFVSGGYDNGVDLLTAGVDDITPTTVTRVQWKQNRDMLGGYLLPLVKQKNVFFHGELNGQGFVKDNMLNLGSEIINLFDQYVQYSIDILDDKYKQGFASNAGVTHTYDIFVPYGRHLTLQGEINRLAAASGNDVVQA